MRRLPFLVALLLLTLSLAAAFPISAQSPSTLEVDAGTTQVAYDGGTITLKGQARNGTAPYSFAWTGAAASRFGDPASPTSTFNASGLPVGNVTLTLTVTDAASATASDTVVLRVDLTSVALARDAAVPTAVPDSETGTPADGHRYTFGVPARTGFLWARLGYDAGGTPTPDLDLVLYNPFGPEHDPTQGHAGTNPERVNVTDPFEGNWRALVQPQGPSVNTRYSLSIRVGTVAWLPEARAGSYEFGSLETQALTGTAAFGVAPYTFEWDVDGDGWFEHAGASALGAYPVGTHVATLRVTDGTGLSDESRATVIVRAGERIVKTVCGGDPSRLWAMEFTASRGSCWIHGGHHTYYMGGTYAFRAARGYGYAVEQEFAPSDHALNASHPFEAPIHVQISLDGRTWTEVGRAMYDYVTGRQYVFFDVAGSGQPFRFLRLHAPLSLSHGLSGYFDHSDLRLEVDLLGTGTTPHPNATRVLGCERGDLMEDFFADHPCWFGGLDRYDAPSFFHTYVVGPGSDLTRIRGNFTLAPWRTDDFQLAGRFLIFNVGPSTNATTKAYVQTSADGVHWTDVATVQAVFGVQSSFDVAVTAPDVTFVRLFPEYHPNFDNVSGQPSHHHPRGFFLDSSLLVDGAFVDWT